MDKSPDDSHTRIRFNDTEPGTVVRYPAEGSGTSQSSGIVSGRPRDLLVICRGETFSYNIEYYSRTQFCYANPSMMIGIAPDHACYEQSVWAISATRLDLLSRIS